MADRDDLPTVKEASVNGEAVTRLLAAFINMVEQRRYLPGERLPSERELASRFGVGRAVVREALSTLERLRYIERRANSGVFLTKDSGSVSLETLVMSSELDLDIGRETLGHALEVRRIIEIQGASLACLRRTEADLDHLQKVIDTWSEREARGDSVAELDYDFHVGLFQATGNPLLVRLVTPFYIISRTRRHRFFDETSNAGESNAQHQRILDAVRRRDAVAAEALMSAHIGRVERWFNETDPAP